MADNAFFFLIVWEIMALTAYCLVSFEHEKPETRSAGVLYFVMSHIGTGCIMLAFLLLFQASGGFGFAGFHALGDRFSAAFNNHTDPDLLLRRDAAFLLFLVGFGVKRALCRCTPGCRRRIRSRPATCPRFLSGVNHQDWHLRSGAGVFFIFSARRRCGGA